MRKGDLVVVYCESKQSTTWTNSTTGGQTWTAETAFSAPSSAAPFARMFWCVFNGTWGANPVFSSTSSTGTSAVMHVFRACSINDTWSQDVAQTTGNFSAPSTPFTVTITGVTTIAPNAVVAACWTSNDDNTWGSLSGSGWNLAGFAQYRNLASTDMSMSMAYKIMAAAGATGNVSKNEATLGGDEGGTSIMAWKDVMPPIPDLVVPPLSH
jgi:hypothetical protein